MTRSPDFDRYFQEEPEPYPEGSVLWDPCPGSKKDNIPSGHTGRISFIQNGSIETTDTYMSFSEAQKQYSGKRVFNTESHEMCPECSKLW